MPAVSIREKPFGRGRTHTYSSEPSYILVRTRGHRKRIKDETAAGIGTTRKNASSEQVRRRAWWEQL